MFKLFKKKPKYVYGYVDDSDRYLILANRLREKRPFRVDLNTNEFEIYLGQKWFKFSEISYDNEWEDLYRKRFKKLLTTDQL
jgi:hypothetical protein